MAAAETARLIASLELQDKNFTRGLRNVERGVGRVDKKLGAFSGFVNRNVGRALDSIALRATQAIGSGLEDLATLEDATTSVTGAIAQVGKGWEVTGEQIATWANEIEASTEAAFDDKAIVASAATLIRYGKVTEDNLRPALEVMTDLAAKTGDTESAATLLGKALADPAKAAGKLARQGVILTKQQQKQIKAMVKAGKTAEAQALLLDILSDTTKDAAKNSAGPYRDALNKLGDAGEDLRKSFAVGLLPVIEEVSNLLSEELAKPETLNALKGIGQALADTLKSLISSAKQLPWGAIGTSLQIAGAGAKMILDAFLGLPPWLQTAVVTGWGLNKLSGGLLGDLVGGLIKGVLGINAGVVNLKAATVVGGGMPAGGAAGGAAAGASRLARVANAVKILGAVTLAGASIALLAQTFQDFAKGVGENQRDLLEKVNNTARQGFKETVANLEGTSKNLAGLQGLDRLLAEGFGGSEITKNFEMAADRIIAQENLTAGETVAALRALKSAQEQAESMNLETPKLNAAILELSRRIGKTPKATPPPGMGGLAAPARGGNAAANEQKAELRNIKNAQVTLNTSINHQTAQQSAELANIKNATVTGANQQRVALIAQTAVNAAGNMLSVFQSASQVLAAQGTTTAANNTTVAARGAGNQTSSAMASAASRIVSAVNALDLSVNVTTVNRTSTVNNRYGPESGSSNGDRTGGGWR